jgi:nitrate reductase gamma subunit
MASTAACADPGLLLTRPATSQIWTCARPSIFGDVVVIVFLLAQCFDGVFTYVGVMSFGLSIEANPLIATLMTTFGHGVALTAAKMVAAALGICLHLRHIHSAVAVLAGFYIIVAIVPWLMILFA